MASKVPANTSSSACSSMLLGFLPFDKRMNRPLSCVRHRASISEMPSENIESSWLECVEAKGKRGGTVLLHENCLS